MRVLKFGGTSVGSPSALINVLGIVQNKLSYHKKIIVVCSAMSTITNKLIEASKLASDGNIAYKSLVNQVKDTHQYVLASIMPSEYCEEINIQLEKLINQLLNIISTVYLSKQLSKRSQDEILSFGELLSCTIITQYMKYNRVNAKFIDSRKLIKTNSDFGNAIVDYTLTQKNIKSFFKNLDYVPIVTGFIASNIKGDTTTLGRGGSDYTASILAEGVGASEIEIWTDVDGVMTADPKYVENAFTIPTITYQEAIELAHTGAKIIYPPTLYPVFRQRILLLVKNTFNPEHSGTLVGEKSTHDVCLIKGISSISEATMIIIQGFDVMELSNFTTRITKALSQKNIMAILATKYSSESSICVAVSTNDTDTTKSILNQEFKNEITNNKINPIVAMIGHAVVSIIGEKIQVLPELSDKFFTLLSKNKINIIATNLGYSKLSISVVVKSHELHKTLNVVHEEFFGSLI